MEERASDVNFSMGVASCGRTKLRWQPFLHFQLVSNINLYLALLRALQEAILYLLSHLHFTPKVFYVGSLQYC